jgi:Type II secretory pathway, component PulF
VVIALTSGETIAAAFDRAPKLLPEVARQIVVAGAEVGHLDRVLERLADDLEAQAALRGRLIGALIYPAIVGVVALAVVAALMVYVLPQIVAAFGQTQQKLPLLTRSLIGLGAVIREHGHWLALGSVLLAAMLAVFAWRLPRRTRERLLARIPLIGDVLERSAQVRLLATLALLVRGAVPLPRALESTARAVGREAYAARLQATGQALERGSGVAAAFQSAGALDAMSLELLHQGEAVGDLASALDKAAQLKKQALEQRLHWLATLVEPIMIVVLGGIVLLLVLAVMMPIVTLNSAVR